MVGQALAVFPPVVAVLVESGRDLQTSYGQTSYAYWSIIECSNKSWIYRALFGQSINIFKNGDSTIFLCNLCWRLITIIVKIYFQTIIIFFIFLLFVFLWISFFSFAPPFSIPSCWWKGVRERWCGTYLPISVKPQQAWT